MFFVYVITREPTRDFERSFARWAADLRRVTNEAELADFIERRFTAAKSGLSTRFDDALRRLYSRSVQQYRVRYILAKLAQYIELQAFGETERTKWLNRYTGGGFEIEHIFPRTPSQKAAEEFGESVDSNVAERLGNLVLAEKSINASLGPRPYSEKRPVYKESPLLLTRSLPERPKVGVNTKIDMAVADLYPFDVWNEAAVATRQEKLMALARVIWNIAAVPNG